MPQINEYVIDSQLTSISVAFQNEELVHEKLFPRLNVTNKQGVYYKYDKSNLRVEDTKRTGKARASRVEFALSKANYGPLAERALEELIEKDEKESYPSEMDCFSDATINVTSKLDLGAEVEAAAIATSTSVVTQNTTLSGTSQWSDFTNSDPEADVQTGMDTIFGNGLKTPNKLFLSYPVYSKLKLHPNLLGRMSVTTVRVLTPEMLASIFGVEEVIVCKAAQNSANEGQTDSLSYVWGKDAVLAYVTPQPALKSVTSGYKVTLAAQDGSSMRFVDRWYEQGIKCDVVRVNDYYDFELVAVEAMYLIKSAVA